MERLVGRGGEKYAKIAQDILGVIILMPNSPLDGRYRSAGMCIMNRRTGRRMSTWIIGKTDEDYRICECRELSEKQARDSFRENSKDLLPLDKAVVGKHILSCFVHTDDVNLALALMVSVNTGNISLKRAEIIARVNNNQLFFRLLELLKPIKK